MKIEREIEQQDLLELENVYSVMPERWAAWDMAQRFAFIAMYEDTYEAMEESSAPDWMKALAHEQRHDAAFTAGWIAAERLVALPEFRMILSATMKV